LQNVRIYRWFGTAYAKTGLIAEQIVDVVGFDISAAFLRNLKQDAEHLELLR
jgi:hypothetical protein